MPHELGMRVSMMKRLEQAMTPEQTHAKIPKRAVATTIPRKHQQPKAPKGY